MSRESKNNYGNLTEAIKVDSKILKLNEKHVATHRLKKHENSQKHYEKGNFSNDHSSEGTI